MTAPLRTLIVDDEPLARRVLERLLADSPEIEVVGAAADGLEALAALAQQQVDLLLADIAMPHLAGLELVERLPADRRPAVVFVTAHQEHAVLAFDLGVADYLLKPVAPERLALALSRVRQLIASGRTGPDLAPVLRDLAGRRHVAQPRVDHLWVHRARGRERVAVAAIEVIRAEGDYVRVFTVAGDRLADGPLDRLQAMLDPLGFLRVHRSTLVRIGAVVTVASDVSRRLVLTTASGHRVTTGRRSTALVREALGLDSA